MSGVKCTGDEMSLSQCQHHRTVNCQKAAARFSAGVICSESEVPLHNMHRHIQRIPRMCLFDMNIYLVLSQHMDFSLIVALGQVLCLSDRLSVFILMTGIFQ